MSGAYSYIRKSFGQSFKQRSPVFRARVQAWARQRRAVRVQRPLNPGRARELGYEAKREFVVVRARVGKGKRARPSPRLGRKPGKNVKRVSLGKSLQWLAEQKALRTHNNLSLVGSYFVGSAGDVEYYEVILRDLHSHKPKAWKKANKAKQT